MRLHEGVTSELDDKRGSLNMYRVWAKAIFITLDLSIRKQKKNFVVLTAEQHHLYIYNNPS